MVVRIPFYLCNLSTVRPDHLNQVDNLEIFVMLCTGGGWLYHEVHRRAMVRDRRVRIQGTSKLTCDWSAVIWHDIKSLIFHVPVNPLVVGRSFPSFLQSTSSTRTRSRLVPLKTEQREGVSETGGALTLWALLDPAHEASNWARPINGWTRVHPDYWARGPM